MYLEKSIINHKPDNKKIRKRGCSSSSSSSLVRRYRFKRAILVPMWNTRTRSPSMATSQVTTKPLPSSVISAKDKDFSVSARKLAATLWEINDLPPSRANKDLDDADTIIRSKKKTEMRRIRQKAKSPNMSDPSYSPIFERMKGFEEEEEDGKRRVSHKLQLADYYLGGFDALSSSNFKEVGGNEGRNSGYGKHRVGVKNHLKEARSGLSTSKKLLKALNQICLNEHQHSSSMIMPLISALRSEVDQVCIQMDQVIQEQKEVENLMKHFGEEKAAWRRKEREKVRDAISNIAEELEVERKLRRQTERLNKKIAKEMDDVKASNLKISKELEMEKRAKEILEQICDELAKGIGEDRAKVEELKRESAKVRDEVEKEREMLQFADVLREERVQMKLLEAKYQFEEKNAVLEKLRKELEAYMKHKDDDEENGDVSPQLKKIKDVEAYLNKKSQWGFEYDQEKENDINVGDDVEADTDSDLHSIELKLDNDSRSFKWSYACENDDDAGGDESKRVSIESIGRKSLSEKIQWGSICFNKGTNIQENSHHFDQEEESSGSLLQAHIHDNRNDETENYRPIMGFQRCDQPMPLQDSDVEAAGRKSKC